MSTLLPDDRPGEFPRTLLLDATAVRRALAPRLLVDAVERALIALDRGDIVGGPTLRLPGEGGIAHAKSAFSTRTPRRAAVKLNGNFPGNPEHRGLPRIQGVVALLDLEDGRLLALLDSASITALRTAATSAVAARRLARAGSRTLALVGCGAQGRAHLDLFAESFPLRSARLFDPDLLRAEALAVRARSLGLDATLASSAGGAARDADLVVTATPATAPVLFEGDVVPGAFVAAVGADDAGKRELSPDLLARSRVVVDSLAAASAGGDLAWALAAGALSPEDVHGELPALVAGRVAGRVSPEERFVFDSTGLGATDLAAAELAYQAAMDDAATPSLAFAGSEPEAAALFRSKEVTP